MWDHNDEVIEIGSDGVFDLSTTPKPPPVKVTISKKESKKESKIELSGWELKKQRGNDAYAAGNLELAVECYTVALKQLEVSGDVTHSVKQKCVHMHCLSRSLESLRKQPATMPLEGSPK
jgi:hypothetical protein